MRRSDYFNYIEEKLTTLSTRIKNKGKINILDLHIYSENFFAKIINQLLKYNLKNMNTTFQNVEGIDLIDHKNKIVAQVSATCTKEKIENSLCKNIFRDYPDYKFKFIPIVGDATSLRKKNYKNPHNVIFEPEKDIYDLPTLLKLVLNLEIKDQYELYKMIKDELGNDFDIVKIDTNLASIINVLAEENLSTVTDSPEINPFEILRKIEFNLMTCY